ncbi:CBS domain-containing protein, partial [bacterium]|nr:CBS domain-containing protein [bacterium]
VDDKGKLLGIITDGDIRRAMIEIDDIRTHSAETIMTQNPIQAFPTHTLQEAVKLMEERSSQISVLPVVDPADDTCLGLIRLHDIYQPHLV